MKMNHNRRAFLSRSASLLPALLAAQPTWPASDLTTSLIVPNPAGAGNDASARLLARILQDETHLSVIVENISGASGIIAANKLLNTSAPDNTLMLSSLSLISYLPNLSPELISFNPSKEFIPLAIVSVQKFVLVASTEFDANAFLQRKSRKSQSSPPFFGMNGSAGVLPFMSRCFASLIQKKVEFVPYRGMNEVGQAMLSGQIQLAIVDEMTALKLQDSGKARPVLTLSSEPCILFPDLPLWSSLGYPYFSMDAPFGVFACERMSTQRFSELAEKLGTALQFPAFQDGMRKLGIKPLVKVGTDAQQFVKNETMRAHKLIARYRNKI